MTAQSWPRAGTLFVLEARLFGKPIWHTKHDGAILCGATLRSTAQHRRELYLRDLEHATYCGPCDAAARRHAKGVARWTNGTTTTSLRGIGASCYGPSRRPTRPSAR